MFTQWIAAWWRRAPPAIWGKLPDHADCVRSGVPAREARAWSSWFAQQGLDDGMACAGSAGCAPVAFALPPGTLAFAKRRFVVGVIAPSVDSAGRPHPLVIYRQARPRRALRHFEAQLRQPLDWQFWLARAAARHAATPGLGGIGDLEDTVRALWNEDRRTNEDFSSHKVRRMQALLNWWAGPASGDGPIAELHGVGHLPWADWPHRLQGARAESAFWQQDAEGRFIGAASRLRQLWSAAA